jgi:replicative DNA helicase
METMPVSAAFCTGTKPVFKLTTALGRTIRATANHKFLTICGWKRLDELTLEDMIALPRVLDGQFQQTMSDAELGLLGHLIGDGCTLPKHSIQYTTREYDLAEIVQNLAHRVFGDEIKTRIHLEPGKNWYQVFLSSTRHLTHRVQSPVRVWLDKLGAFGLRSYEKFVPDEVFKQPLAAKALFLRHLWATDGSILMSREIPSIYYASSSNRLAVGVQSLLLHLGINATLRTVSQGSKGRTQYHVVVSGTADSKTFIEQIGAVGNYKTTHLGKINQYFEDHISNTNRDVIPNNVWRMHAVPAMQKAGLTAREMQKQLGNAYCGTGLYKQNVSRERAARLAEVVQSDELTALAQSEIYWDRLIAIEPDGETDVYDLTVPGYHNFVANNLIVHNSIEQDADLVIFLYRDVVYNEATEFPNRADLIVAKHRNGPTGVVSLHFEKSLTKFSDARTQTIDLSGL